MSNDISGQPGGPLDHTRAIVDPYRVDPNRLPASSGRAISDWATAAVTALALVAGIALVYAQEYNTVAGWRACFGHLPDLEAGGRFAATILFMLRLAVYPLVLLGTTLPAWFLAGGGRRGAITYTATLVVVGAVVFWLDYYLNNWLIADDWTVGCPNGSPPGWPEWLGIRPR